jgi:hypothetical protein
VLAPETLHGTRIVASPEALDALAAATFPTSVTVLRFAPDDVFVIGAETIGVSGEHAIVAPESGFVGSWLSGEDLIHVAAHIDWPLPAQRPVLAQGFVASVPAKLYLTAATTGDRVALLVTNAPYGDELWERLS